jgi:hypothetical protein
VICAACGKGKSAAGILCDGCAARICGSTALCPEQITSGDVPKALAVLADRWGRTHPVGATTVVGRSPGRGGLAIAEPSVSRRHAVLEQSDDGWRLRDLDSANGTRVNAKPVTSSVLLRTSDLVSFADVAFYFVSTTLFAGSTASEPSTLRPPVSLITEEDEEPDETFFGLRSARVEMSAPSGGGAGVFMLDDKTTPLTLAQFELVSTLAKRMTEETSVDERVRGFVRSTELLVSLAWDTSAPDDNHLKQLVRRVRRTLARAGMPDVIEARHGFGYRLRVIPK